MTEPASFLAEPPEAEAVRSVHESYVAEDGYVANYARVWCWRPEILTAFADLRSEVVSRSSLSPREVAVMVVATASTLGDSYCSLAWGKRLSGLAGEEAAAALLKGDEGSLSKREAALARWARKVVQDPNATTEADVEQLRDAGLGEQEIFEATVWIGMRLGFSTINDALGIRPDRELARRVPKLVGDSVKFGRAPVS